MAYEQHRAHIQALCEKLHITNPIEEHELVVGGFWFWTDAGELTRIPATDMNRAGRLFFQAYSLIEETTDYCLLISGSEFRSLKECGSVYFAEKWLMDLPLIRAFREAEVGSSRVDLQACKLEYSIVSPK